MLIHKVIVITGASSGLGKEIALEAAKAGANVVITGRNKVRLEHVMTSLAAFNGKHASYVMDVNETDSVNRVIQQIYNDYEQIDVMINNAGYGLFAAINEMTVEQYEQMMNTNFLGVVRCTKAVLPIMLEQGNGHIINIASLAGMIGNAKSTSYASTKHAVLGFTNSLRMELRGKPITVSAINPGPIETPFFDQADPTGNYIKNVGFMLLQPEQVARKVVQVIKTKKVEVNMPQIAGFALKLYHLCPRLIDKVAGKWLNKK